MIKTVVITGKWQRTGDEVNKLKIILWISGNLLSLETNMKRQIF